MIHRLFTPYKGEAWGEREIDARNPIVARMQSFYSIDEGGGANLYDALRQVPSVAHDFGSTSPWTITGSTPGIAITSAATLSGFTAPLPAQFQLNWPMTIAVAMRRTGTPSTSAARIFGLARNNTFTAPPDVLAFYHNNSVDLSIIGNAAGVQFTVTTGYNTVLNADFVAGLSINAAGNLTMYVNGVQVYSDATGRAAPGYQSTACLNFGTPPGATGTRYFAGTAYWGAWWNRALSSTDHLEIGQNINAIRQVYRPRRARRAYINNPPTSFSLDVAAGSFALTGNAASFNSGLAAAAGAYAETGNAASFAVGLATGAGAYAETGGAVVFDVGLGLGAGAYALTGGATSFGGGLAGGSGSYAESGGAASFDIAVMTAAGAYALTGGAVTFNLGTALIAGAGSFALAGGAASFGLTFQVEAGSYAWAGGAAALIVSAPTVQTFRETVLAKLQSIDALTNIVGTRIYPGVVPQTHDFGRLGPALAFFIHGYPRGHTLSGSDRTATATVEFLVMGYLRSDVDRATLAIWDAIDGVPSNPWGDGTITILSCVQQDESDHAYPPRDGSDQWVFSIMSEYKIMHRVSSPTLG